MDRLLLNSLQTVGHAVAAGASTIADEATQGRVPELTQARQDQSRRFRRAASGVSTSAPAQEICRVAGVAGTSLGVLGQVVTHPAQLRRLLELVQQHDFAAVVRALTRGARLENDFFPGWVRRAGGYFPKFAQVLSVRGDLIHNREVLAQFSRCLEDMPARSPEAVRERLLQCGWADVICEAVGDSLSAGTVAQVNALSLPDGTSAVVKVTWPETYQQMQNDFRLFEHAHAVLGALRLDDEQANSVAAIFSAVGRSEQSILAEFDMRREASALRCAASLCATEWPDAQREWLREAAVALQSMPPALAIPAQALLGSGVSAGIQVRVPEPCWDLVCQGALGMTLAGGESMHRLLSGMLGEALQRETAGVLITVAVPYIGWLLLCKSTTHLAHVDPHAGNFRWDSASQTLWVLDWGSHIELNEDKRRVLCLLVSLLAAGAQDRPIAELAREFGVGGPDDVSLATLMRGIFNVTGRHAAQDHINAAAVDEAIGHVADDVIPIVRCLATLGGMLQELRRRAREELQQDVPLSLAALWAPFAARGLR